MRNREKTAIVIGAGPAGIEAALKIGEAGFQAILAEREAELGGTLRQLYSSFPRWEDPRDLLDAKISQLENCPRVSIMKHSTVEASQPHEGGFLVTLRDSRNGTTKDLHVDAVVLATGFAMMDLSIYGEYGYGIYPEVLNALEFEARLREWSKGSGQAPQGVALIKCVGSRDRSKGNPYCSKICCMYTAKQAGLVKDMFPDAKVYVFYMDYRAAGKEYEEFVRDVIEKKHVRYVRGRPAKVLCENGRLLVRAEDTLVGLPVEVLVDVVVLASAAVPHPETRKLAEMFGAKTDEYGFLENDRFDPVKTADKVFFAGGCGFAVETPLALQQGAAAAAAVIVLFNTA
jgi:heterodisulfide reductase subunit A